MDIFLDNNVEELNTDIDHGLTSYTDRPHLKVLKRAGERNKPHDYKIKNDYGPSSWNNRKHECDFKTEQKAKEKVQEHTNNLRQELFELLHNEEIMNDFVDALE